MSACLTARKRHGRWWWRCTLCRPACGGSTADFARLLVSLRHHERVRRGHHREMARRTP